MSGNTPQTSPTAMTRKGWIATLASAPAARVEALWRSLSLTPRFELVRGPEIGLVMLRGRAGGSGGAFNLGEATATRCSIRLESGQEGHALALGRDKRKATIAALCDALMHTEHASRIRDGLLTPLDREEAQRRRTSAEKAAATRVEFFTMVRGEDA